MTELIPPGTQINQYRIVKQLGTGAVVDVYLATHIFLNVDRVIKVLKRHSPRVTPELFESYCERYRFEWQLAASIHHPNLVEVYDLFEAEDALLAIVEYAPNGSLKNILDVGDRLDEDWVVEVLRDCALGLSQLHKLMRPALVHCYVNPKSIVLDKNGRAKITNFGRARSNLRGHSENKSDQVDDYDWRYQAPELARGKVAPTSDIYSLGCVAFEMLTGKSVVSAKVKSPRQVEPSVSEWLDKIVLRMLCDIPSFSKQDADNVSRRYVDMDQLLKILSEPQQRLPGDFLDKLVAHFSLEEMRTVCYEIGVDHERIVGEDKKSYAREMIRYFQHRENMGKLIERLRSKRPNVDW